MHPYVYCSIIYNSQIMEAAQVSINRWIYKEDACIYINKYLYTHTHTVEYYSAIKKEWNLAICNDVDEAREYCAKWNNSVIEKLISYDFTHV